MSHVSDLFTLLDFCMSSLRQSCANLLCRHNRESNGKHRRQTGTLLHPHCQGQDARSSKEKESQERKVPKKPGIRQRKVVTPSGTGKAYSRKAVTTCTNAKKTILMLCQHANPILTFCKRIMRKSLLQYHPRDWRLEKTEPSSPQV